MRAKDTYHHGNLRRALMDESLAVIAEKGVDGLSLRDVAGRIGVSHAAPYHHFADKAGLLRALGSEGMTLLDGKMAEAEQAASDGPSERLLAVGKAYVIFAVEHREYFAVFTAPETSGSATADEEGRESGATWRRLLDNVIACQEAGVLRAGDPTLTAVFLWSVVHGFAELWLHGPLASMPLARGGVGPFADAVLRNALGPLQQ